MTGEIGQIINQGIQGLTTLVINFVESARTFDQASGIYTTLKQNGIYLTVPYIAYILNALRHKETLKGNEAKDAKTVIKCLEEYSED